MEQVQPLLQASAALSAGGSAAAKPKGGDAEGAAGAALERVLYLLTRAGRLLWGHMAPASALEASQALVEPLAGEVVQDILSKRVRPRQGVQRHWQPRCLDAPRPVMWVSGSSTWRAPHVRVAAVL